MAAYKGVGPRIREQMAKLGYVRADGEPDVQRFCWDFRYDRTLVYAWLSDKATPFKDLVRLTRDLDISVEWLLTGQERGRQETGKAVRRQGRRPLAGLLLALGLGSGSVLGWPPSPSAAGQAPRLGVVQVREKIVATQTSRRRLARRLLPVWCPA